MLGLLYDLVKLIFLIFLPFALLIRAASYVHEQYAYNPWVSIMIAVGVTSVLMIIYFSLFYGKMTGRFGDFDSFKRRALLAVLMIVIYCGHAILFFNTSNFKNPKLKSEMDELHPIVRLSLSTLVYMDQDLVITDASRAPEDYKKMGLPTNRSSLHYKQASSNYAHAVDIRTKGRHELKNALVTLYFRLMGMNTLRHHGTADHLHVSLHSHDHPHAK